MIRGFPGLRSQASAAAMQRDMDALTDSTARARTDGMASDREPPTASRALGIDPARADAADHASRRRPLLTLNCRQTDYPATDGHHP